MWSHLTNAYGSRFTDSFGAKPTPTWEAALSALTSGQIIRGLQAIANGETGQWPPSMPEFVALCKSHHPVMDHRTLPSNEVKEALRGVAETYGVPFSDTQGQTENRIKDMIFHARFGYWPVDTREL